LFCWRMWPRRVYFFEAVKPHYYADYHYLFTDANPTPKFSLANAFTMARETLHDALWIDRVLYPFTLGVFLLSIFWFRNLWRNPLYTSAWVSIFCFMGFVVVHGNMQPRYFHLMLVPTVLVAVLGLEHVWRANADLEFGRYKGGVVALKTAMVTLTAVGIAFNVVETLHFLTHPEYTFVNAARSISDIIRADRSRSHLLLSISGSQITLITGVASICDEFGTEDLETKALRYNPGWYAAWNDLDEGTMSDITPHFRLFEVAKFRAFDDPERNLLILYRMTPRTRRASRHDRADSAD
jgi:hypothetical protein